MYKKLLGIIICTMICSSVFAENTIRRGNLIIDLDTGKITIANDTSNYTSLLENDTGTLITTTGIVVPIATGITTTGVSTTTDIIKNTTGITTTATGTSTTLSELEKAILRGHNNKLTIYSTVQDFKASNAITRQEAAKFLFQASVILGNNEIQNDANCTFTDKDQIHIGLQNAVEQACNIGLMKGSKGLFRPVSLLSRAEALTVISRIAGYKDSPTDPLRWNPYYKFIKSTGILNKSQNESTMEYMISRGDIMLLLYRLSQKSNISIPVNTTTTNNTTINTPPSSNSTVSIGAGISDDPEFITALLWMNKAGMTKYWRASDYNPMTTLTRGQSAQFLAVYDQKFDTHDTSYSGCLFNDTQKTDFTAVIQYVCEKGILRGGNKLFRPDDAITKAEFVAAVLNMLNEYPGVASGTSRSQNIFKKALSLETITRADESTFDKPITRYEVALFLSRLYLKNKFTKSLSESNASYNIISPIENDQTIYTSGQQKVFIDVNSIDSRDFSNGFISLFGTNYKLSKKQVTQYFPTSYVWYGEIHDINEDSLLGMISMSIGQKGISKSLIEGYIVMNNEGGYYTIQSTDQVPYYIITKVK